MNNRMIEEFFRVHDLGEIQGPMVKVEGGLLHRMYRVNTSYGVYALKHLNPQIIKRPGVKNQYETSEVFAELCYESGIPASAAMIKEGHRLQVLGKDHFMIFHWEEGKVVPASEVKPRHAYKIGQYLYRIHKLKKANQALVYEDILWDRYLDLLPDDLVGVYRERINLLKDMEASLKEYVSLFPSRCWSHRDLDPKNVMWQGDQAFLIDWEASGPVNPDLELLELALYWSRDGKDEDCFLNALRGYQSQGPIEPDRLMKAIDVVSLNKLKWLEYNLNRTCGLEVCMDQEEEDLARNQVLLSLDEILAFSLSKKDIISLLNQL